MKKILTCIIILAVFAFVGCELKKDDAISDETVVTEISDSLNNNENGLFGEMNQNMDVALAGSSTRSSEENMTRATVTITVSGGIDERFQWDAVSKSYKKSYANLAITTPNFSGTITNATVEVKFFNSIDATGDGIELINRSVYATAAVKSMTYVRHMESSVTHNVRDIIREVTIDTKLTITGIHDDVEGTTVNGTRTAKVHVDRGSYTGDWTITKTFTNLSVIRKVEGLTRYYSYEGIMEVTFEGTYNGPNGKKTVTKNATVELDGTRTVEITVDGSTATIEITNE